MMDQMFLVLTEKQLRLDFVSFIFPENQAKNDLVKSIVVNSLILKLDYYL